MPNLRTLVSEHLGCSEDELTALPVELCQAAELRVYAKLTEDRRPILCAIGFHRFGTFQRLILTSRSVCTRCGAVLLSTGFDGIVVGRKESRAELLGEASRLEALVAEKCGEGAYAHS